MAIKYNEIKKKKSEIKFYTTSKILVQARVASMKEKKSKKGDIYYQASLAVNRYENDEQRTDWYIMVFFDADVGKKIKKGDLIRVKGWVKQIDLPNGKIVELFPKEITKIIIEEEKKKHEDDDYDFVDDFFDEE